MKTIIVFKILLFIYKNNNHYHYMYCLIFNYFYPLGLDNPLNFMEVIGYQILKPRKGNCY